jgi:hypothetical protein
MPKKAPPPPSEPPWRVILEDIRSQNRATLEAVEASRTEFGRELQQFRQETNGNFAIVFGALREHTQDIRELKTDVAVLKSDVSEVKADVEVVKLDVAEIKTDLRRVDSKVDHLSALEPRVAALERSGD